MISDADRIAILRSRCLDRKHQAWKDIAIPRAASLAATRDNPSWQERQGLATQAVLSGVQFAIDDLELLAGRLAPRPADATDEALAAARATLADYPAPGGQTGHCELDLGRLMESGVAGLRTGIESRLEQATDPGSIHTLRSFGFALEGLYALLANAATEALQQVPSAAPDRRPELLRIAEACTRIMHHPPRSFFEAIQLLWLAILAVQLGETVGLVGPGRLDRSLYPFYKRDRDSGRLTRDEALRLVESLYLLVNEFVPDGLAIPVMAGGRDAAGNDTTNDLSFLCLEALRRTKLVYPTVGVCWHPGTPAPLTDLAVELMAEGYSNPAFFNDVTIQRGLRTLGVPPEDACHYINSTCVEITPVGGSNVWVASPYYNLCGRLLDEIADSSRQPPACGRLLDEIADSSRQPPASFGEFTERYFDRLRREVEAGVAEQDRLRDERRTRGGKPLQSLFTRDCLARGRDIDNGGARYNWVECSFVGLANLADSLVVVRNEVFTSKTLTLAGLKAVLDGNFGGNEALRQRFLNLYPKYGQANPDPDGLAKEAADRIADLCRPFRMKPDNSPYLPGTFVWIMHEQLGRTTGATPDGRLAGTPFADGAGPAQGRETKGPTAAILSTTGWDHAAMIGGVAFNMKFSASLFRGGSDYRNKLRGLLTAYLERGGFEVQVNVVDAETLRHAQRNPDQYRDLVVRIGGYTDYFTRISHGMQEEVIQRTAYEG